MKPKTKSMTLTVALAAALSLVAALSCAANTLTVTSTADDGSPGTLRAALASAADGDTINITATGTIYLNPDIDSGGGALGVDKNVTITGPGQARLTVDGQSATRVFFVWSNVTVPTVTIAGLTIANGKSGASGGGVYSVANLTLADCTLSGNYALEGGGGVHSENSSLVITRCTLSGNTSYYSPDSSYGGGAVAFLAKGSSPTLTIEDSLLINNTASYGGGIIVYAEGIVELPGHPTVTITGSTISNNAATYGYTFGGGIAISVDDYGNPEAASATVTVENSTLSGNSVVGGSQAMGGAIANLTYGGDATLTIKNSTLNGNSSSQYGGAVFSNGTLNLVNSTLSSNSAFGGGAVHTLGTSTLTNCALNGNTAAEMAGAIMSGFLDARLDTTLTITRCTLNNNTVAPTGSGGGAIINLGVGATAALTIVDSTLSANSASGGGAILNAAVVYYAGEFEWDPEFPGTATVNIKNSTLSGNSAQIGGGISHWKGRQDCSATLTVDNSTLSDNWADDTFAGAIASLGGVVNLKNTILNAGPTGANLWNDGDLGGSIVSLGYNLSSDDGGGFLTATGDLINTDPKLGALADNGGPTWTCALLADSPAINAGNSTDSAGNPVTTDQRGVFRPQGSANDIGAFELHPAASPMDIKTDVLGEMRALRATLTGKDDQKHLDNAISSLKDSLKPGSWIDANHLQVKYGKAVLAAEQKTVQTLTEILNAKKPPTNIPAALLQDWMSRLVLADRMLAVTAIDASIAAGGNTKLLSDANKHLADGDAKDAQGKHADAIAQYSQAWESAFKAQGLKP